MLCVIKPPLTDITTALDELSQDNAEAKLDQALTQLAGYVKKWDLSTRFLAAMQEPGERGAQRQQVMTTEQ